MKDKDIQPTGRRYRSVRELIKGEGLGEEILKGFEELQRAELNRLRKVNAKLLAGIKDHISPDCPCIDCEDLRRLVLEAESES